MVSVGCATAVDLPDDCAAAAQVDEEAVVEALSPDVDGTWVGTVELSHKKQGVPLRFCEGEVGLDVDLTTRSASGALTCTFPADEGTVPPQEEETWSSDLSVSRSAVGCEAGAPEMIMFLRTEWTLPDGSKFLWDHELYASEIDGLILAVAPPVLWWNAEGEKSEFTLRSFDVERVSP